MELRLICDVASLDVQLRMQRQRKLLCLLALLFSGRLRFQRQITVTSVFVDPGRLSGAGKKSRSAACPAFRLVLVHPSRFSGAGQK